jgi:uncharacterized protein (TIGR02118 family)
MIKLIYCITKKPGLTDAEFFHYWKNIHGPIGARIPRLRKLVQSHRITVPGDRHPPTYDGIAELWFDTIEDLLAARQSPRMASLHQRRTQLHRPHQSRLFCDRRTHHLIASQHIRCG